MDQKNEISEVQQNELGFNDLGQKGEHVVLPGSSKILVLLIVGISMFIFTWHACTRMVAAGDTWVAMACGRHFINHGVDTVEPFSANSHHAGPTEEDVKTWPGWAQKITHFVGLKTVKKWHPTGWINQNWLTHVIFYWLTTTLGSEDKPFFNALVYWKFAIYALSVLCIYNIGRQLRLHPLAAALAASFALFAGRSFLDVRPAGFSNLLVPTLLLIWILATYRNILWIWLTVPLTVFWANVHGGYIYTLIMMIPFIGFHVMVTLPKRWTSWLYHSLGWLVLFFISSKGLMIEGLPAPAILSSKVFLLILIAAGAGLAITCTPRQPDKVVIAYHSIAAVLLFFVLLGHLFPRVPDTVVGRQWNTISANLNEVRMQFVGLYLAFVVLGVLVTFGKTHLVTLKPRQIGHLIATYGITFIAVILFNPFHLTNLTHTFVISVSKHAARWRMVHEWHPAFEWSNPVGTAWPFLIIFLIGLIAPLLWLVSYLMAHQTRKSIPEKQRPIEGYEFPKMDLSLLIVVLLTIYMAYRSRRFIPIASFVACPVLALLLQNCVDLWFSVVSTLRNRRSPVARDHWRLQPLYVVVILGLLASFGFISLVKHFKHVNDNSFWGESLNTEIVIQVMAVGLWVATAVVGCLQVMGKTTNFKQKLGMIFGVGVVPLAISVLLIKLGGQTGNMTVLSIAVAGIVYLSVLMMTREMTLQTDYAIALQTGEGGHKDPPQGSFHRPALLILLGFLLVVGSRVAIKYNSVYLQPWPQDPDYYSVFMRMTASHLKPFEACQFIRDNKLHGDMMNYWTEGGFIAYGQTPDPNTGKTPLQLFMDGRAQAAYDVKTFDLWSTIWAGFAGLSRDQVRQLELKKNKTQKDYQIMGESLTRVLRSHHVWVALVPKLQFDSSFARALGVDPNWPVVYIDDKQKLFVDITTDQGLKLFNGVDTGQNVYPNEYTRVLNQAFHKLTYLRADPKERQEGLEMAIKAFNMKPCDIPAVLLLNRAALYPDLKQQVAKFALDFLDDLNKRGDEYRKHNGYAGYLEAAWRMCGFLAQYYSELHSNPQEAVVLEAQARQYIEEIKTISDQKRW